MLGARAPAPSITQRPTMTSLLLSLVARVSILSLVILNTCHGYYVPGVRPHEFLPGEEVPMKVNSLTSIHTQVRLGLNPGGTYTCFRSVE
jgi:hypothetical protein